MGSFSENDLRAGEDARRWQAIPAFIIQRLRFGTFVSLVLSTKHGCEREFGPVAEPRNLAGC